VATGSYTSELLPYFEQQLTAHPLHHFNVLFIVLTAAVEDMSETELHFHKDFQAFCVFL
jgi:hypothetical protein